MLPNDARNLNELLWTCRDGSFVPHDWLQDGSQAVSAPVAVSTRGSSAFAPDLLINLCRERAEQTGNVARIAEIVSADDDCRQRSRGHFAAYRDDGHTLDTHKL